MSTPTTPVVRCRLRRLILERCRVWQIPRKRVPRAVIDALVDDLNRQVDVRISTMLQPMPKVPSPPAPPKPKKARIYKRALKGQPTLF